MRSLAATVALLGLVVPARAEPADPVAARRRSLQAMERGQSALSVDNLVDADRALQQAIREDGGNHVAWYHLGELNRRRRLHNPAEHAFERAWQLGPDVAMYAMWAGIAREENGGDGTAALQEAVRLEPRLFRAHWYLGRARVRAGDDWGAAHAFTAACRANPTFSAAFLDLASLYLRWDEHGHAIEVLVQGRARAADPEARGELELLLGRAYEGAGRSSDALAAYGRALALPGDRLAVHLQRGLLLARLGKKDAARHDLEAYLAGSPSSTPERAIAELALQLLGDR